MKLRLAMAAAALAAATAMSGVAAAQTPPAPANFVLRIPAPAYRDTPVDWVAGQWVWRKGHRVYIAGHEEHSRHGARADRPTWVPGHWDDRHPGHRIWVQGHWS